MGKLSNEQEAETRRAMKLLSQDLNGFRESHDFISALRTLEVLIDIHSALGNIGLTRDLRLELEDTRKPAAAMAELIARRDDPQHLTRRDLPVNYFFDWKAGLFLRAANKEADEFFGGWENQILLAGDLMERAEALGGWRDDALNWDSPNDPGPWRQAECDEFNRAESEFFKELDALWAGSGVRFERSDQTFNEDPDLDQYLDRVETERSTDE